MSARTSPGKGLSVSPLGSRHLQVGLEALEMGNPAPLLRRTQDTVSSLFLLTPSDSPAAFGVFVTTVASVTRDALDIELDHELLRWWTHNVLRGVYGREGVSLPRGKV